jgi:AI-2 transport protein TqsA
VVLGPMGAILAVPLTLFLHAVLVGQDPDRRWARTLLAGTSGAATAERRATGRRPGWPRPRRRAGGSAPPPASAQPDEPSHRVPVRPSA